MTYKYQPLRITVEKFENKPLFTVLNWKNEKVGQFSATLEKVAGNVGSIFTAIVAAIVYGESIDIEKKMFKVELDSVVGSNTVAQFFRQETPYLSSQNILFLEKCGAKFIDDDGNRFSPAKALSRTAYVVRNIKVARKE